MTVLRAGPVAEPGGNFEYLHRKFMKQRLSSQFLFCILLLASIFSSSSVSAWTCDGRVCSTSANCCCVSETQQDKQCQAEQSISNLSEFCKSRCACQLLVKPAVQHLAVLPTQYIFSPFVAVLPLLPISYINLVTPRKVIYFPEVRGQPEGSVALSTPSLRAPPIS